jgi:DNA-binding beta-propeller fold protein YncE
VHSPPPAETPAGQLFDGGSSAIVEIVPARPSLRVDGRRDRVLDGTRSAGTCREPVDVTRYDSDRLAAVLCGRERVVELFDRATLKPVATAPAGTGPARIASDGRAVLYVTDVAAESLLVYHLHPRFELIRRVNLPGGPFAIAYDADRASLWVTLTARNRVVEYAAGSRPVPLGSYPTVRQPDRVMAAGGMVVIDETQVFEPGRAHRTR